MVQKERLDKITRKINRRLKIAGTQSERIRKAAAGFERAKNRPPG